VNTITVPNPAKPGRERFRGSCAGDLDDGVRLPMPALRSHFYATAQFMEDYLLVAVSLEDLADHLSTAGIGRRQ
jgi:hypothetical protein